MLEFDVLKLFAFNMCCETSSIESVLKFAGSFLCTTRQF